VKGPPARTMIKLRTANSFDKKDVLLVYRATVGPEFTLDDEYCDRLLRTGCVVVAELEGNILGFGGIDVDAAEQLTWLYLLPKDQRTGIGSQILTHLEEIARKASLPSIRLHSARDAVGFYLRHGYTVVPDEERIGHDHVGVDMIKRL
jgi:GNAT superfamily N-acetyltransferase